MDTFWIHIVINMIFKGIKIKNYEKNSFQMAKWRTEQQSEFH